MRRFFLLAAGMALMLTTLAGCSALYSPFSFPVEEGSVAAGRQAFIDQQCHQCHTVAGVELPDLAGASEPMLELGGEVHQVRSYAELVTSIINPNHIISENYRDQLVIEGRVPMNSPMPTPDLDNMSVRQLIDIVAFLDSRYELVEEYQSDE